MNKYLVTLYEDMTGYTDKFSFSCEAKDIEDAEEQATKAYPKGYIIKTELCYHS